MAAVLCTEGGTVCPVINLGIVIKTSERENADALNQRNMTRVYEHDFVCISLIIKNVHVYLKIAYHCLHC